MAQSLTLMKSYGPWIKVHNYQIDLGVGDRLLSCNLMLYTCVYRCINPPPPKKKNKR